MVRKRRGGDTVQAIEQSLLERHKILCDAIESGLSVLSEVQASVSGDFVESALGSERRELTSRLMELNSHELWRIESALRRIKAGRFGICRDCGGKISAARLGVIPHADRCIKCAKTHERHGQ